MESLPQDQSDRRETAFLRQVLNRSALWFSLGRTINVGEPQRFSRPFEMSQDLLDQLSDGLAVVFEFADAFAGGPPAWSPAGRTPCSRRPQSASCRPIPPRNRYWFAATWPFLRKRPDHGRLSQAAESSSAIARAQGNPFGACLMASFQIL